MTEKESISGRTLCCKRGDDYSHRAVHRKGCGMRSQCAEKEREGTVKEALRSFCERLEKCDRSSGGDLQRLKTMIFIFQKGDQAPSPI